MEIHFLGGATTVTGSQFLLVTERARVLVDCGMFQGSPNEAVRNRIPLGFDPTTLDAILLTHAHLDHCGLIPHVVAEGFHGPIIATHGTCELAELVMLDSGRLQEEFAKREARWERKHPDEVLADDAKELAAYEAAVHLSEHPETPVEPGTGRGSAEETEGRPVAPDAATIASASVSEEAAEAVRPGSALPASAAPPPASAAPSPVSVAPSPAASPGPPSSNSGRSTTTRRSRSLRASTRDTSMPATSLARRSSASVSSSVRAARNERSSSRATSVVPARQSSAIRPS